MLPHGKTETKTSSDTVTIFLQQFFPDTYKLGDREEFETRDDEKLSEFCRRMKIEKNINSLALLNSENWDGPTLLNLPKQSWLAIRESNDEEDGKKYYTGYSSDLKYDPNRTVHSWRLTDGDFLFFKDNDVPLKDLSEEEIKKFKEEEDKKRVNKMKATSYGGAREESLVIKQQDVAIDDL